MITCRVCGGGIDPLVGRCPNDGTTLSDSELFSYASTTAPAQPRAIVGAAAADTAPAVAPFPSIANLLGDTVGGYQIEAIIGRGGMGTVYRGRDPKTGAAVAVKILDARLTSKPGVAERILQEAAAVWRIDHHGTVRVLDSSEHHPAGPYIVMELLEGRTVGDLLRQSGRLNEDRLVGIATQVCDALAAAHGVGVIHRDLKPENIYLAIVDGREVVKVMDFGIAKLTEEASVVETVPGELLGTPQYMSPEQWGQKPVDGRSDIYSLGVVLYELATGRPPFAGQGHWELLKSHMSLEPVPPHQLCADVSRPLSAVIQRCLAKNPELRFATMSELAAALRDRRGVMVAVSSRRRRRLTIAAVATATVVASAAGVVVATRDDAGAIAPAPAAAPDAGLTIAPLAAPDAASAPTTEDAGVKQEKRTPRPPKKATKDLLFGD